MIPPEKLAIHTEGGPHPGDRVSDVWSWPLPDILHDEGGHYAKVSESALPSQPETGHVMRGARYVWEPDSA